MAIACEHTLCVGLLNLMHHEGHEEHEGLADEPFDTVFECYGGQTPQALIAFYFGFVRVLIKMARSRRESCSACLCDGYLLSICLDEMLFTSRGRGPLVPALIVCQSSNEASAYGA